MDISSKIILYIYINNRKIDNQLENVFICGDWTIEELPNTMEAAALSGKKISEKYF